MLRLYNTLSRKLETFKPLGNRVKIYTCGPTVYNYQHIGNYAAQIYWDLLVRTLLANGYPVKRVLNLTDVGHLVSDGDEGEDKLEKGASREGKSVWDVADYYIADFQKWYRELNLTEPDAWARATSYIDDDIQAVDAMTERGFTYETADGVYFDTSKYDKYADFAKLDLDGLQAGARVTFSDEKRNAADFAVWKFIKPGEKHAMRWEYLGRPGYPGWHLECSTIIHAELGEPIDIHTGGIDHIPVHHTNEIAQTYAAYGHALAKTWLHCNFITIDGEKISKSLGNVYLFTDLAERGFSPIDYKMWVLSGSYQGERNFTFDSLAGARNRRQAWRERIALCYQKEIAGDERVFSRILEAVNNNLNSAEAFAIIDTSQLSLDDWSKVDELFGLKLLENTPDLAEETYALISRRTEAKKARDFKTADEIRDELSEMGIGLRDNQEGSYWYYL
ncbi:cysteine--tRNA ligase [Candidatus Saccharibacteria bacterium]|nr:cysteine--tRNA ligase [Candidatus Saccharibacteria bacterium]